MKDNMVKLNDLERVLNDALLDCCDAAPLHENANKICGVANSMMKCIGLQIELDNIYNIEKRLETIEKSLERKK